MFKGSVHIYNTSNEKIKNGIELYIILYSSILHVRGVGVSGIKCCPRGGGIFVDLCPGGRGSILKLPPTLPPG